MLATGFSKTAKPNRFNPNLGGLFRGSFYGGGGGGGGSITPSKKLVEIVLETWNLVLKT